MKKSIVVILCIFFILCVFTTANAESLWVTNQSTSSDDDIDYQGIISFFERQDNYKSIIQSKAQAIIDLYRNLELTDFSLYLNDAYLYGEADIESIATIGVNLRWQGEEDIYKTRLMMEIISDFLADEIHCLYPDVPIDRLCVFWEIPPIVQYGNAAKYTYHSDGKKMYLDDKTGKSGPLYMW